jgi:hypothetical protein
MFNKNTVIILSFLLLVLSLNTAEAASLNEAQNSFDTTINNDSIMIARGFRGGGVRSFSRPDISRYSNRTHETFRRPENFDHGGAINPNNFDHHPSYTPVHNEHSGYIYNHHDDINRDNITKHNERINNINNRDTHINNIHTGHDNYNPLKPRNINVNNVHNNYINVNRRSLTNYPDWHYHHYYRNGWWNGFWHGYNYRYPWGIALGTFIGTLPLTVATLELANSNQTYYYNEGIYYVQSDNGQYEVTQPASGLAVNNIPEGYFTVLANGKTYYYYFGTYYHYDSNSGKYMVVEPPVGAVVPYIPDGFEQTTIDGKTVLQVNDTYYLPQQDNSTTVFKVVDASTL